jgi:hypothetical protein
LLDRLLAKLGEKNHTKGSESENMAELVTPGQIKTFFSCRAGDYTPTDSQLSHAVQNEFKRQLAKYGYVKTCDNRELITKVPKLDTRDNTRMSLYWVVEGNKPIPKPSPGLEEENIALKLEVKALKQKQLQQIAEQTNGVHKYADGSSFIGQLKNGNSKGR